MAEKLVLVEQQCLQGHSDWVTSLASGNSDAPNLLVSASRDKSIITWDVNQQSETFGTAVRAFRGHNHFIQDMVISSDNQFALSASWDNTMRLWDLNSCKTLHIFQGHTKDVMSVTISPDNRQIVSGSRDKTIRLWNTLAQEKYRFQEGSCHTDWVSCVRFTPPSKSSLIISGGWDGVIKLWRQENLQLKQDLEGHDGAVNSITISPDGIFCASGGQDRTARIWDTKEGKLLYQLEAEGAINSLSFSPLRYWLVAATDEGVVVWDLETKGVVSKQVPEVYDLQKPEQRVRRNPQALSIAWSADGDTLYAGFSDNKIRVYQVMADQGQWGYDQ